MTRFGPPSANEIGFVGSVECVELGDTFMTTFCERCCEASCHLCRMECSSNVASILLRGATSSQLDEVERTINDCLVVLRTMQRDPRIVPGAGACELDLAQQIQQYADGLTNLSRHAVMQFASAMEVVPRVLAENNYGAIKAESMISRLISNHTPGKTSLSLNIEVRASL